MTCAPYRTALSRPSRPRQLSGRLTLAVAIPLVLLSSSNARAQSELQGRVLADTARRPVANAEVSIPKLDRRTMSDSLGRYRLLNVSPGEHLVITRAVGFRPDSSLTTFEPNEAVVSDVLLRPTVTALPTVAVEETARPVARGKMAGFEERKALGIGSFIEREQLQKEENRRLAEILASNVPGMRVFRGSMSKAWAAGGRGASNAKCAFCRVTKNEMLDAADIAAGAPLACYVDVYLDGAQVYTSSTRAAPLFDVNSLNPSDIQGIEVFTGTAQIPTQYNKTSGGCGVMLIWTRTGR